MALKNRDNTPALILTSPSEVVPVPGPDVLLAPRQSSARDVWKVGVAVDLLALFKKDDEKK